MRSTRVLAWIAAGLMVQGCAGAQRRSGAYATRKAMAQEHVRRSEWAAAFPLVNALHADDASDPDVLVMRGLVYREQKLPREAEADLLEALRLAPDHAAAHSTLAVLYDQQGRGPEALEHHRRASDLEPRNPAYLNNLAFALFARGRPRDAIPVYEAALRMDPTNSRIRNNLGFAHAKSGDFRSAGEQFRLSGGEAEASNNLGFAYQATGNLEQAFDAYVAALRLNPDLQRARANLVQVAARLKRDIPRDLQREPGP